MFGDKIQRWLCRGCGLRFSDLEDMRKAWSSIERFERIETKALKSMDDKTLTRQICVSETKNLGAEQATIQNVPEVCRVYCATANPVEVVIAETEQGRGILGVIDGFASKGIETDDDISARKALLRTIGYKQ